MSMAMPSSACGGPCWAHATSGSSPVWYRNRSTVWHEWCHNRWSVHVRGLPSALVLVRRKKNVSTTRCCSVSSRHATRWCTHWCDGLKRRVWQTIAVSPVRSWAATTASASAKLSAIGISTSTCLPASITAMACAACSWVGVVRMTASTPGWPIASSRSRLQCGIPRSAASSSVSVGFPPARLTTSTPSMRASPSRCLRAMAPSPATQTFIGRLPQLSTLL